MKDYLFTHTPFGGYKREEVEAYIKELDRIWRENEQHFTDRQCELNEKIVALDASAEKLNAIISEKDSRIADLLKKLDEKDERLALITADLNTKYAEADEKNKQILQAQSELEEKNTQLLQAQFELEELKNKESAYNEIVENVDLLIEEVKAEAEKIKQQANKKASEIIAQARQEREIVRKMSESKPDTASMLERLARIRKAMKSK